MTVKKLTYSGFRNLEDGVFEPGEKINVLYGRNAQGKTNLIEALWLFTGSRSFRGSKDAELVKFGAESANIEIGYDAGNRSQNIKIVIDGARRALLNGVSLGSPVELSGEFCAVIFSPEHLGLVKEGPALRRRFIDAAICQMIPRYASAVLEYKKALTQRNALLKDITQHAELLDTLDIWDEKLCKTGAHIIFTRLRYLKKLGAKASEIYEGIAKNGETLTLDYLSSQETKYDCDLSDPPAARTLINRALLEAMENSRAADIDNGYTHAGPHRDDLQIFIAGISAKTYGSQGQQRSAVLALKLAEAAVLSESIGEPPVLLLDDVMSELDHTRQDYLLNNIQGMQVFITCCYTPWQGELKNCRLFEMDAGRLGFMI
jgi:DNA replication and repair protein RecF